MGWSLAFIILSIIVKSICQSFFGAENTFLEKILLELDSPFYKGSYLGSLILIFFSDNWKNICNYLDKSFVILADSGDEDSDNESFKSSRKGSLPDNNKAPTPDKGKTPEQGLNKPLWPLVFEGETMETRKDLTDHLTLIMMGAYEVAEDTNRAGDSLVGIAGVLKKLGQIDFEKLSAQNKSDVENFFTRYLQEQGKMYSNAQTTRKTWINARSINLLPENQVEVQKHIKNLEPIREKYISKLQSLSKHPDSITQLRLYYSALNEQRSLMNKELNKADDIVFKDIKKSAFCTIGNDDSKKLIKALQDYTNAKLKFTTQDNDLKKRLGEVINKKK